MEVIAGLKEMIRSWLDDNHPEIPPAERLAMAERMDISLIEQKKAESMKTIFELNQAVRLSFIEMQFIKKARRERMLQSFGVRLRAVSQHPGALHSCYIGNGQCALYHG